MKIQPIMLKDYEVEIRVKKTGGQFLSVTIPATELSIQGPLDCKALNLIGQIHGYESAQKTKVFIANPSK